MAAPELPPLHDSAGRENVRQWAETTLRNFLASWFIQQRGRVIDRLLSSDRLTVGMVRDLLPQLEDEAFRIAFENVLTTVTAQLVAFETARIRPVVAVVTRPGLPISNPRVNLQTGRLQAPRQISVYHPRTELPNIEAVTRARVQRSARRVVRINQVTRQAIRRQLRIGIEREYTREQIARGVPQDEYRGIGAVVEMTYRNRDLTIARTELAMIGNNAALDAFEALGYKRARCYDSAQCGLRGHNDRRKPAGHVYNIQAAHIYSISHPNCIRRWVPVIADE